MGLCRPAFTGSVRAQHVVLQFQGFATRTFITEPYVKQQISEEQHKNGALIGAVIAFLLLALPLAVWLDLTELSKRALRRQAADLNSVITSVRSYYAANVVGRILANPNG